MEAAPDPLLCSLERLLEAKPDDVPRLFVEGEGIFGGGAMHTGVLWGLEVLAWSPDFLSRVTLILAELARLDPGGRMANRPIGSLYEIFLPWHPGTYASIQERLAAIDLILDREPDIGWKLLAKLLPTGSPSASFMTAKPHWRDFGDPPEDARTWRGWAQYASAIVERAVDRLGNDVGRWGNILDSLRVINSAQQKRIIDMLQSVAQESPQYVKTALWEKLRDFVYQHRTFRAAEWALSEDILNRLEAILPLLAPGDPVARFSWLFDDWLPEIPSGEEDIDLRKKQVEELRQQAVQEILETKGTEGLVELGTRSKYPGLVAVAALPLMKNMDQARLLCQQAIVAGKEDLSFAAQVSGQARRLYGEAWQTMVCDLMKTGIWTPGVAASLITLWPDDRSTWETLKALGNDIEAEYWRRKQVLLIEGPESDQAYQIEKLIAAGRATEAFDRVALRSKGVPTETLVRLFDAAFDELVRAETVEEIRRLRINSYDTRRFLDELRKRTDISRQELARKEYRALPVLQLKDAEGLTIHEVMAEDPAFFVEVLCAVYLPASRDKDQDTKPTDDVKARALAAYRLLEGMHEIPGLREGNQIDEGTLLLWIDEVRKEAAELDRAGVADEEIGQILAHAPEDPQDLAWPHRSVRTVLEKRQSEELERGIMVERQNMRGFYSKGLYEGGAQERALAGQYRSWAKASKAQWPKVARMLERIAKSWEGQAKLEDERAEQRKIR
jgi:hypothetical protein